MKALMIIPIALLVAGQSLAQTAVNKTVPVAAGQTVLIRFDYPKLIKVSTWDKNEVSVQGTVSINGGENDKNFELEVSSAGSRVEISNHIRDMKSIPRRITVYRGGEKITFKTRADFQKYVDQNGRGFDQQNEGLDMEIILEVKVPKGVRTTVEAVYGMVEVRDFNGPITVDATYGGVDASVAERSVGEISAETNYGQIYTNLEAKFLNDKARDENFHTFVTAKAGTGPDQTFESKYGNVYLRKPVTN